MSDIELQQSENILQFPLKPLMPDFERVKPQLAASPVYDKLVRDAKRLDVLSKYPSTFDYTIYRDLELRYSD